MDSALLLNVCSAKVCFVNFCPAFFCLAMRTQSQTGRGSCRNTQNLSGRSILLCEMFTASLSDLTGKLVTFIYGKKNDIFGNFFKKDPLNLFQRIGKYHPIR
jgi:hypothetical protein